jgi:hypothetical protein
MRAGIELLCYGGHLREIQWKESSGGKSNGELVVVEVEVMPRP